MNKSIVIIVAFIFIQSIEIKAQTLIHPWARLDPISIPIEIVLDASGNVYALNVSGNTISKISASGVLTQTWVKLNQDTEAQGIAIDSSGNIYTTNNNKRTKDKMTNIGFV
jgi:hypothetical protein